MNTNADSYYIEVSGLSIEVNRKDIKNFYIGVHPPNGQIRVSAPLCLDRDAIRMAVISHLGWIQRQQANIEKQERQSQREYVAGETHYFEGRRYRLDVVEQNCPPKVRLRNNSWIELSIRPGSDRNKRESVLYEWYREHLRSQLPSLIDEWKKKIGVDVNEVRIKRMKTQWGSCNIDAKRIWLNLELAKKPNTCLIYVLVHEMTHLIEPHHNDHFRELMDKFLPQWQNFRDELNKTPLAHEKWKL